MTVQIYLDKPNDSLALETFKLAEATDLVYRRMRNRGYARRFVDSVLADEHSALDAAAAKIIKAVPVGTHPVTYINARNLAVLRVGTMSARRAICLGSDGRIYAALRGRLLDESKFLPTADTLKMGFALFSVRQDQVLKRVATLRPSLPYFH